MRKNDLPTRILGIFAHEDDETIGAGGLLARNSSEGGESRVLCFGGCDETRRNEFEAACKILGASHRTLGYLESERYTSVNPKELMDELINEIITFKPSFIVTHNPDYDYHLDHVEVAKYARSAATFASNRQEGHRVEGILLTETHAMYPTFDVAIDISNYIDQKQEAMRCHTSQLHKGSDYYFNLIEKKATLRGLQSGVKYAEAFRYEKLPVIGMFNNRKLAL